MTPEQHREAAEGILDRLAADLNPTYPHAPDPITHALLAGLLHATLALAPPVPLWENERALTAANAAYDEVLDTLPASDPDLNRKSMGAAIKAAAGAGSGGEEGL